MDWSGCIADDQVPRLTCIPALFSTVVFYAFLFAGTLAVVLIIWGGIRYIRSGGDPKQTQGARQTLTYALLGLILILSSVLLINIISYVTGVGCIRNFGFTSCK